MFKKFSLLRPLLAIILIAIPLYPKFPLFSVNGTYVAIRLDDIIIAVSVLVYLIYQIKSHFSVFKTSAFKLFLAYFIAITISFLNAYLIFKTDSLNILGLNLLRRFEYISLFFLTISTIQTSADLPFPLIFSILTSIGVAIYGYGQKYLHFPIVSTMNEEFSKGQLLQMDVWTRISSTFAGHYDLAAYLSIFLVIFGAIVILQKKIYLKLPGLALWLVLYHILTLTASRVSIFAYLLGMVVTLFLIRKYYYVIPVVLLFGLSILNSKDLNQRLIATIPAIRDQFFNHTSSVVVPTIAPTPTSAIIAVVSGKPVVRYNTPIPTPVRHQSTDEYIPVDVDAGVARSGEIRFNVEWPRALTALHKSPLFGTGLGSITLATDNDYLRSLGESGILGFITFMVIFVYFFIKTIPFFRTKVYLPQILFGAMLVMLANATLIDVFEASKVAYLFWILMGIYYQTLQFNQKHQ